jgi:hypothetical protein
MAPPHALELTPIDALDPAAVHRNPNSGLIVTGSNVAFGPFVTPSGHRTD